MTAHERALSLKGPLRLDAEQLRLLTEVIQRAMFDAAMEALKSAKRQQLNGGAA